MNVIKTGKRVSLKSMSAAVFLSLAMGSSNAMASPTFSGKEADQALLYLNDLREQAGLMPFVTDERLQQSSLNHAVYLANNRRWGHQERRSERGYTGETPLQRMLNAGYSSRHNSENVSSHSGRATPKKSINGLMSAIYHRFGFLSFDYDEIGIGYARNGDFHSFVYNMGNSIKAALCDEKQKSPVMGAYVYKVCADTRQEIAKETFNRALTDVQSRNSAIILWPPVNGVGVPPAFYDEAPDPLPSYDVSGYPVSVQFNPAVFSGRAPQVTTFNLYRQADQQLVELAARFNQQSDINKKFSELEHAIFPRYRLEWDTVYEAELSYQTDDGKSHTQRWSFKTAGFEQPVHVVSGGEVIQAGEETLVIYSPPTSARDAASEYLVSYQGFDDVKVIILDAHTLLVTPSGARGQAMLEFHGKRFSVVR